MRIGAMNHPGRDVLEELEWIAAFGLDFVDLTLEPPAAAAWQVDPARVRAALDRSGLEAVGHTAYYLPVASPFPGVREAAVAEFVTAIRVFAEIGVRWINIHPDTDTPLHPKSFCVARNIESMREIARAGREVGVGLMIENIPGESFNSVADLALLFEALPELRLHLDVGHCHLSTIPDNAAKILEAFGDRLQHVHLHDNRGGTLDLHLGLGCGNVDVAGAVRAMKAVGYDETITLEVFSPDRQYLAHSRDVLRALWEGDTVPR